MHMSSSAGKRSQSRASGQGWPWQASTGAQLSLTATHRLRQGWIKLNEKRQNVKQWKQNEDLSKSTFFRTIKEEKQNKNVKSTYVSRQTGAMREQRKARAWGWQPVCSSGLQSSERGTTSPSKLLWPKKLGNRISEYPTSLQTFIWLGMATQRVDWPMSNASNGYAIARRATVKNTAMFAKSRVQKVENWACAEDAY